MPGQTITAYDAVLKEFYEPDIADQVNAEAKTLAMFKEETEFELVGGRRVVYPARIGRNEGVGAVAEAANLPTAGNQGTADFYISPKYIYGRVQLTGQVIKQSRTNKMAFKQALAFEMEYLVEDLKRELNRQLQGWGQGVLAVVSGAHTTPTTVQVTKAGNIAIAQSGLASARTNAARYFRDGMIVGFLSSAGAFREAKALAASSAVASDLQSIVLTGALTGNLSDGDLIVRCSTAASTVVADTGYNNEVEGLLAAIDDSTFVTTYHNISRSTYPIMKSHVLSLGRDLTLDDVQLLVDAMWIRGGGTPNAFLCEPTVRRSYLGQLNAFRRYTDSSAMKADGGYKGFAITKEITYADVPLMVDQDAPYGMLHAIDKRGLKRFVVTPGEWADDDGTILLRVSGQDVYEGRYRIFLNVQNDHPNRCGRIENISTAVPPTIPSF